MNSWTTRTAKVATRGLTPTSRSSCTSNSTGPPNVVALTRTFSADDTIDGVNSPSLETIARRGLLRNGRTSTTPTTRVMAGAKRAPGAVGQGGATAAKATTPVWCRCREAGSPPAISMPSQPKVTSAEVGMPGGGRALTCLGGGVPRWCPKQCRAMQRRRLPKSRSP